MARGLGVAEDASPFAESGCGDDYGGTFVEPADHRELEPTAGLGEGLVEDDEAQTGQIPAIRPWRPSCGERDSTRRDGTCGW
jgi:hypothetical protein